MRVSLAETTGLCQTRSGDHIALDGGRKPLFHKDLRREKDFANRHFPPIIEHVGFDEISLKKRHKLYVTVMTDLTDPNAPVQPWATRDRSALFTESESGNRALRSGSSMTAPSWRVK